MKTIFEKINCNISNYNSLEVYFEFQSSLDNSGLDLTTLDTLKTLEENKDNIYAGILEPLASIANPIEYEKLLSIYQTCKKEDIVVIFDEVYSGFMQSNLFILERKETPTRYSYLFCKADEA